MRRTSQTHAMEIQKMKLNNETYKKRFVSRVANYIEGEREVEKCSSSSNLIYIKIVITDDHGVGGCDNGGCAVTTTTIMLVVVVIDDHSGGCGEGHDNYSGNNMTVMVVMVMIGLR
ncbi:hypothetical protein JHK86_000948 [Glycine max]|nr:hypothetical protein JHK86_000948 [Glycine max]